MAEITFGVGCSHTPLLATKPEDWDLRANDDRNNPAHWYRGGVYSFTELEDLRKDESLADQIGLEIRRERDALNQKHLDFLSREIKAADLDILVIFGDDQHEVLLPDNMPAFMIFHGADVPFMRTSEERVAAMTEGVRVANWARIPDEDMMLPGSPALAEHVVRSVIGDGFDVSVSDSIAKKENGETGIGHAFGFYYHRLLDDFRDTPSLTTLPIYINTFFPPNQPPMNRVLDFGRAVGRAVRDWPFEAKVGIAASGGFSHFVIDEELDRRILDAMAAGDIETILAEPESHYQSGTSEIKNWIAAMGALEGNGMSFNLVDYVPCYRSTAGTGNACVFGLWQAG